MHQFILIIAVLFISSASLVEASVPRLQKPENFNLTNNQLLEGSHDGENYNAIHIYAMSGQTERIRQLLNNSAASVFEATNYGNTPFHLACEFGQEQVIHLLLNHNNDVGKRHELVLKQNLYKRTGLHLATLKGNVRSVKIIRDEDENGDLLGVDDMFKKKALYYAYRALFTSQGK